RPWNRADSRRRAHHSAALDTAHETVPVLNFSHTILRRESTMMLPDYIPNERQAEAVMAIRYGNLSRWAGNEV
ncbi:MAG: hypothetical protein WA710_23235, partial [Pseudolabrys sp.]